MNHVHITQSCAHDSRCIAICAHETLSASSWQMSHVHILWDNVCERVISKTSKLLKDIVPCCHASIEWVMSHTEWVMSHVEWVMSRLKFLSRESYAHIAKQCESCIECASHFVTLSRDMCTRLMCTWMSHVHMTHVVSRYVRVTLYPLHRDTRVMCTYREKRDMTRLSRRSGYGVRIFMIIYHLITCTIFSLSHTCRNYQADAARRFLGGDDKCCPREMDSTHARVWDYMHTSQCISCNTLQHMATHCNTLQRFYIQDTSARD